MAETDALKKYLDAGMAFTALTRARAEQVVKDLVAAGELQRSQAKGAIDELLERSKKNGETLAEQVRKEVDSQLASLGLVRKGDLERLEAELAELKGTAAKKKAPGAEKETPEPEKAKAPVAEKKAPGPEKAKAPAKKAAGPSDKAAPPKKAAGPSDKAAPPKKAANAKKQETSLSSLKKGDDQAGVGATMPAKKPSKKQG